MGPANESENKPLTDSPTEPEVTTPSTPPPTEFKPTITTPDTEPQITPPTEPAATSEPHATAPSTVDATPAETSGVTASPTAPPPQSASSLSGSKPNRKKLLVVVAVVALVLLLGGGYVFGMYLPNQPQNVYKNSLSNTAKGYDKLINHLSDEQKKHYNGADTNGSFKFAAGSVAGEGSFSGQSNGGNSTGKLDVDIAGQKFTANTRTIQPSGQSTPDLYVQLTGIKSALDSYGLSSLDKLDGQWVSIDHTLLDGIANSANNSATKAKVTTPTQAQIQDALNKVGEVNRQYVFTTGNQAVLENKKYLGKSTQDGRSVYGYQVGYNKTNLKAYVKALGEALDASTLNAWVKQTSGKSISDAMSISDINTSIDKAKADYTFNMYVDAKTKLIHQLHFADTSDPANNYVNLGLNYTGGDEFPFVLELHAKSGNSSGDGKITVTLNTNTNKLSFGFKLNATSDKTPITATANIDITPTDKSLTVTAPAGAKPVMELLQSLNLGGLLGASSTAGQNSGFTQTTAGANNPFTLTQ